MKRKSEISKRNVLQIMGIALGLLILTELILNLFFYLPNPYKINNRFHMYIPAWNWGRAEPPFSFNFYVGNLRGVDVGVRTISVNKYGFLYPTEKLNIKGIGDYKIAVIGGSTVECMALKFEKRWPEQLEQIANNHSSERKYVVLNMGLSGHDTRSNIATLVHHVVHLGVDCVVLLIGGNDMFRVNSDDIPMLDEKSFILIDEGSIRIKAFKFLANMQITRRVRLVLQFLLSRNPPELPYFYQESIKQKNMKEVPQEKYEKAVYIPKNALIGYVNNIMTLAAVCREHGIKVLFVTQPSLWKKNFSPEEEDVSWMRHREIDGRRYRLTPEQSMTILNAFNKQLIRVCQERGYPYVDLAAIMPKSLKYFYDDVHFNNKGASFVASTVYQSLNHWKILSE